MEEYYRFEIWYGRGGLVLSHAERQLWGWPLEGYRQRSISDKAKLFFCYGKWAQSQILGGCLVR